jgi:hypothetical protein
MTDIGSLTANEARRDKQAQRDAARRQKSSKTRGAAERASTAGMTAGQEKAERSAGHNGPGEPEGAAAPATNSVHQMLRDAGLNAQAIRKALEQAEITPAAADAQPTDEMRKRFNTRKSKSGLTSTALGVWLLTGDSSAAAKRQSQAPKPAAAATTQQSGSSPRPPREGSALHAAITVLKAAREPLTPQEIYDRAVKRGLAGGLKGKTPVATLGAQLATANKRGIHVERPTPGHYALRAEGK